MFRLLDQVCGKRLSKLKCLEKVAINVNQNLQLCVVFVSTFKEFAAFSLSNAVQL